MSLRLSGLPCTWRMPTALDTREQSASRCKYVHQLIETGILRGKQYILSETPPFPYVS